MKFPKKIQVWDMMSYRALSELHFIPVGQTVTADYYINEILDKTRLSAMNRKRKTCTVLQRKMLKICPCDISTRWCPSSQRKNYSMLVKRKDKQVLGEGDLASELSRLESYREYYMVDFEK